MELFISCHVKKKFLTHTDRRNCSIPLVRGKYDVETSFDKMRWSCNCRVIDISYAAIVWFLDPLVLKVIRAWVGLSLGPRQCWIYIKFCIMKTIIVILCYFPTYSDPTQESLHQSLYQRWLIEPLPLLLLSVLHQPYLVSVACRLNW